MTRPSDDRPSDDRPSYDRPYDAATRSQSREVRRGRAPRHPASRTGRGGGTPRGWGRAFRLPTVWLRRAAKVAATAPSTARRVARSSPTPYLPALAARRRIVRAVIARTVIARTVIARTVIARTGHRSDWSSRLTSTQARPAS